MNRRGFLRSTLAGIALAIAAPILARRAPAACRHLAFHSGPGIDGVRCLDCGAKLANGSAWDGWRIVTNYDPGRDAGALLRKSMEYRELPKLKGSVIRFRRDPSKVLEL